MVDYDDEWGPPSDEVAAFRADAGAKRKPRRKMSAKALALLAEAQKKRWAAHKKAAQKPQAQGLRRLSDDIRAKIVAAVKKRWAKAKEEREKLKQEQAKRKLTARDRARIAAAQRKRWVQMKEAHVKPNEDQSKIIRNKSAASMRARWAQKRLAQQELPLESTIPQVPAVDPLQPILNQILQLPESAQNHYQVAYLDPRDETKHRIRIRNLTFSLSEHPFFTFVDEAGQQRGMQQSRICEVYRDGELIWQRSP